MTTPQQTHSQQTRGAGAALVLQNTLQKSTAYLLERGIDNGRREAEWLFVDILGMTRMELYTQFDMLLSSEQAADLRTAIVRRGKREPLAYILGTQDFCGLSLRVSPAVLVPRCETEELVEEIVRRRRASGHQRVLDIGTGSGAIALALKHQCPTWDVAASDISAAALAIAAANAAQLGLEITCHHGHLLDHASTGGCDIIVANLPYIAEEERSICDPELAFEPHIALFAADHGLELIRELCAGASSALAENGILCLEFGYQQGAAVQAICAEHALHCELKSDMAGHDRMGFITRA